MALIKGGAIAETDPSFGASAAAGITAEDVAAWNGAAGLKATLDRLSGYLKGNGAGGYSSGSPVTYDGDLKCGILTV